VPGRTTKKNRVLQFATERGWTEIGECQWQELRAALPDVSIATIRAAGLPIQPPWCGVPAHAIEQLDAALREFTAVYEARADLQRYCRDEVIAAKDRARWAAKNPRAEEHQRALKAEMVEWMLVWLADPAVFPVWADLRREILRRSGEFKGTEQSL